MLYLITQQGQRNKNVILNAAIHFYRSMSVIPVGFRKMKRRRFLRRVDPNEQGMMFDYKWLGVDLPNLIFDHTGGEKGFLEKFRQADAKKLAEQKKAEGSSLKELSKLENVDPKYKSISDEVQKELESIFIKAMESYVKQDYTTLDQLLTYPFFHHLKKERENLARYGTLTWVLKKIVPTSRLITNWSNDVYNPLTRLMHKEFYALMKITLEHAVSLEQNDGDTVIGCINKFTVDPHFIVLKYVPLSRYDTWKVHCRVTRTQKETKTPVND